MEIRPVAEWNHLDPLLLELNDDPDGVRKTLGDLHDLRMLLEPEIAARAALMATDEQLERMRDAVERMEVLEDDPDAYLEIDVDFHSEIASATGNVVLAFVLDSVRELLRVSRRVTNLINAMPETTVAHRRIYEALTAREPETARQAMRAHLLTVTEVWTRRMDEPVQLLSRCGRDGHLPKEGWSMSSDAVVPPLVGAPGELVVADTELKAGAIGFWGNMVQAVTHIAPGLNVLLGLTFIVSFAGVTAPIAYLLGGIICLGVAVVLTQLAKQFTGAGGYFLYISRTIGPRFGWLTTWLYFLYDPVAIGVVCAFTGSLVADTLKSQYGWNIPWGIWFAILVLA